MPLDTAPLSPKRKLVALAVLLAFLGGSLGLAQFIVTHHKPPEPSVRRTPGMLDSTVVSYKVVTPESFLPLPPDDEGIIRLWQLPYEMRQYDRRQHREFIRDEIDSRLFTEYRTSSTKFVRPVNFGGIDADLFIGLDSNKKPRAYVVAAGTHDHYMILIYSGDIESAVSPTPPLTDHDESVVMEVCRNSRVAINGRLIAAPPPATR
jgi:hypothetical protein